MLRRVFLAIFLVLGLAQGALAERRVALVLAVEDYKAVRRLDNPVNDARAMEGVLEGLGFEVFLEADRDLKRMRRALEDFREDARGADVALVFYAGHGVALDGVNYLLPTDADAASSERLAETSLALAEVQAVLAEVAPTAIVLLDACRDDPFATGGSDEGRGAVPLSGDPPDRPPPVPGLGRIGRADGVLFAFAAAPGETASDGEGENSPFTSALMRHFGTKGVELKSALTLVQQDVYDRSRGKQLPYIESGLPNLVFISEKGDLPEREALLLKMADVTPEVRAEVETVAAAFNMPLAPLYGAVLEGNLGEATAEDRRAKLEEAARSYAQFQDGFAKFASSDPRVAELRAAAEEQLALGASEAARRLISEATEIDAEVRATMKDNIAEQMAVLVERTLSEAQSHILNANAARTELRYDLAIGDLTRAVELYAEVEADLPDREAQLAYNFALADLGNLQMTAGNLYGALGAFMTQAEFAEARVAETPADYQWLRELVWSRNGVGMVLQQQGFLREAEDAYTQAYEVSSRQNADFPDDPALQRDLSQALVSLGEVRLNRNDLAGALAAFQESLSYAQLSLEAEPDDLGLNRDVAGAYERVGDVLFMMSRRDEARDAYDAALKVSKDLLASHPDNPDLQRDLSIRYERLGDSVQAEGDLDAAMAAFSESLRIREKLQAEDPGNPNRKRDTAIMHQRIADIHNLLGDPGTALMMHGLALQLREELVALDASNMVWARDLSISHDRIGDIHLAEGDPEGAHAAFVASRDLREAILALDPGNLPARRDLGLALSKMAQAKVATGDLAAGLLAQEEALAFRRDTLNADPTVAIHVVDVYYTLREVALLRRDLGDPARAISEMTEVVQLVDGLARTELDNLPYLYESANHGWELAGMILATGDATAAVAPAQASLTTAQDLVAKAPQELDYQLQVLLSSSTLGNAQRQLNDFTAAEATYRTMAEAGYALAVAKPGDVAAASDYAAALYWLGAMRVELQDYPGARSQLETAVAVRRWVVEQAPDNHTMRRDLAYAIQKLADTHFFEQNLDAARPLDEEALGLMLQVDAAEPGQTWNIIDVVDGLDRVASYYPDQRPYLGEALTLLEGLEAAGTLPEGYVERLARYRDHLNGN